MMRLLLLTALVAAASKATHAFVHPGSTPIHSYTNRRPTELYEEPSYGEASRKYRRTVYTHDNWVRHRASDRFIRDMKSIFKSGVFKNVKQEIAAATTIATIVVIFNALAGDFTDFQGIQHAGVLKDLRLPLLACPLIPFTVAIPSLGLLLVFRTNKSYQRWDEARKNWGMNINHTRDLVRMGSAFYDRKGVPESIVQQDLERLSLTTWAFVRAMKRHLSPEWEDEQDFQAEMYEKLPKEQADKIISAAHRPNRALQDLSVAIEALPMHFMRKNAIHQAATIFEDNLGSSERILSSPVPIFYSRHTARFVALWLLLLPIGLYGTLGDTWNHIGLIPVTATISFFVFGIEELGTQLEEPFTVLPMQAFCDKIYNWCNEIVSIQPNDNDMFDDEYRRDIRLLVSNQVPIEQEMIEKAVQDAGRRDVEGFGSEDQDIAADKEDEQEPKSKRFRLRSLLFRNSKE